METSNVSMRNIETDRYKHPNFYVVRRKNSYCNVLKAFVQSSLTKDRKNVLYYWDISVNIVSWSGPWVKNAYHAKVDISKHLYRLAEKLNSFFFIYDLNNSRFVYMNPSCLGFFGLENLEIEATFLFDMVHPEDKPYVSHSVNNLLKSSTSPELEFRVRRGENERWLSVTPYLEKELADRLIIGIGKDITPHKLSFDLLNNHNSKKNSILTILAHDLAGPIGAIGNITALMSKDMPELANPKFHHLIEMIDRISKKSTKLIRDFLDQEFLESASAQLPKKRVELVKKISLATQEYFDMQSNLKIAFSCHSNKEAVFVEINEDKFLQVISNLISNALKFTPDGGKIDVYIQENPDDVIVSVSDTGIGIPAKYQSLLFEKFTPARRIGLRGEQSTGLGMSVIKTIVHWHGGKLWVESEEDKGSTFFIEIPKSSKSQLPNY